MGGDLRRWLAAGAVLLVLTASAAQAYFGYADYRGIAPLGTIDALRETLRTRPGWDVVLDDGGVTVFRYTPTQTRTQQRPAGLR